MYFGFLLDQKYILCDVQHISKHLAFYEPLTNHCLPSFLALRLSNASDPRFHGIAMTYGTTQESSGCSLDLFAWQALDMKRKGLPYLVCILKMSANNLQAWRTLARSQQTTTLDPLALNGDLKEIHLTHRYS